MNIFNTSMQKTKLYKSREEAVYHGLVLKETNGSQDYKNMIKSDGSMKPQKFEEASVEDRKRVFDWFGGN